MTGSSNGISNPRLTSFREQIVQRLTSRLPLYVTSKTGTASLAHIYNHHHHNSNDPAKKKGGKKI